LKRRDFILQGSLFTTGIAFGELLPPHGFIDKNKPSSLYEIFKNPPPAHRPFARWWWNGDKSEKAEIIRELGLMKQAGIGGVEINPIKFPAKTDVLGIHSLRWLSPEWVDMLQFTLDEAKTLGIACDLIVGSGWPFGADWLEGNERTQMASVAVKKLEGPVDYEVSLYELFREADPAVSSPYTGRSMEILSVHIVPSPWSKLEDAKDITGKIINGKIRLTVEEGSFALYGLILINGFMEVINGAPGADGPVLNHYNEEAVKKYLNKMSSAIGHISAKARAFFTDSLELEGANWTGDMALAFQKRRGYDLLPWLPFILFRTGSMGNTFDSRYGIEYGTEVDEKLRRIRYDFECTKTELIKERFAQPFVKWCKENGVQSRMQAYGRGFDPLEGSFGVDIPECETWIKNGLGTEMSEIDYRVGRAYSMINKYVSSAAHLQGKTWISCEELTNTDRVFNETLELLKIASDQSIISGVTHAVFHGFNYSPAAAAFPGWVRYGTYFNERNPWWPYLKFFTDYRSRLAAVLHQGAMFADIAVLSPVADMWSIYGAQNEPFPTLVHPSYQTLIWEAIHKNGNGCDHVSEKTIQGSDMHDRYMHYGPRKYRILFLIEVESMEPDTAKKLHDFIVAGGRIFCLEKVPYKSPGWNDHMRRDEEVKQWIDKMKNYPEQFILLKKPENNFLSWYKRTQEQYQLAPYVQIDKPNPFINQIRYQANNTDIFFFINSDMEEGYDITLTFAKDILEKKQGWLWDAQSGERFKLRMNAGSMTLDLGPADSKLIVLDKEKKGKDYQPLPRAGRDLKQLNHWAIEWQHINGSIERSQTEELKDVKDIQGFGSFCGTIIYRSSVHIDGTINTGFLNLGKVYGVSTLTVNGIDGGVQWYGRRIFDIIHQLKKGDNTIEIKVITTMGNYMKTLKDNPVAQYWTSEQRKNQPVQSMGLLGPVTFY
jgi:hypothetical protein